MKKFLLSVFATLFMAMSVFASKANSEPFTVKQSDGTELTVVLHGDEHFHWYSTLDGVILQGPADSSLWHRLLMMGQLWPLNSLHTTHNSGRNRRLRSLQNRT